MTCVLVSMLKAVELEHLIMFFLLTMLHSLTAFLRSSYNTNIKVHEIKTLASQIGLASWNFFGYIYLSGTRDSTFNAEPVKILNIIHAASPFKDDRNQGKGVNLNCVQDASYNLLLSCYFSHVP